MMLNDYLLLTNYIKTCVGEYDCVIHDLANHQIPIDVIIVPPSKDKNYYSLVTIGMASCKMSVPDYYENMNRAELLIKLPFDWKFDKNNPQSMWPIEALRTLARIPFESGKWIGWYHDFDMGKPITDGTKLSGFILDVYEENDEPLTLRNGDRVILYNTIPIYPEELKFCRDKGGKAFIEKVNIDVLTNPVDLNRKNTCEDRWW